MLWENCWIITAINYVTDWSVTKAVLNATETIMIDFLYDEIFINYNLSKELLFNNSTNFLSYVMIYYLKKLRTQHKIITFYYFCINEKIKNLNKMLNFMLTKYFMSKLT